MKYLLNCCNLLLVIGFSQAAEVTPRPAIPVEIVLVGENKLTRVELFVEVDGKPLSTVWDETFAKIFAFVDRNGDGVLDAQEAARLPGPTALRHSLGNGFVPPVGQPPEFSELDRDKDNKVTLNELASYYRSAGLGNVLLGVGRLPGGTELTKAILNRLDVDGDGIISEKEWKAAAETLAPLDKNDDELIGAGELVHNLIYPGASGSILLTPPVNDVQPSETLLKFPIVLLPQDMKDTAWTRDIIKRNKKYSPNELLSWRQNQPAVREVIKLGNKLDLSGRFTITGDKLQLMGWKVDGKLPEMGESARQQLANQFKTPNDATPVGTANGRREIRGLSWLTTIADRDGDGKLSQQEFDAWLDLQEQITRGQVLISLLDAESGLFELLDSDHDGSLSIRELRTAWDRVREYGTINRSKSPKVILAIASHGYPKSLAINHEVGPAWFKSMDRNGDGDVSRREFTGTPKDFQHLDTDGDGLISPIEAQALKLPMKK